jgi:hypothetical protein
MSPCHGFCHFEDDLCDTPPRYHRRGGTGQPLPRHQVENRGREVLTRRWTRILKATLIIVFGVISLVMLGVGIYEYFMQRRLLANARPVKVTITESGVQVSRDVSTDGNSGSSLSYLPTVKFRYELDGARYESTLLRPVLRVHGYTSYEFAAADLVSFPVGASVSAFVSPSHPDKAYLIKERSRTPMIFIIIGVCIPVFIFAVIKIGKL